SVGGAVRHPVRGSIVAPSYFACYHMRHSIVALLRSLTHFNGCSVGCQRAVNGFHDLDYRVTSPAIRKWADALGYALQEVHALVLQRFAGLDPGADDVAIAYLELVLPVVGHFRLHSHRLDTLLKHPHLLQDI